MPIKDVIRGNLLTSGEKIIGHGVNCRGVMGSGIALQIKERWPNTNMIYKQHCASRNWDRAMLGSVLTTNEKDLTICNIFTQFQTSRDHRTVSYDAIADGFKNLDQLNLGRVAIPQIGAGLGGGHWYSIVELINHYAPQTEIVVYELV